MAENQETFFRWRPETGNGATTLEEVAALQTNLNRIYTKQSQHSIQSEIPVNIWIGAQEALVAAEMPGLDPSQIEVQLDGQELRIHAARVGETSLEGAFTLPFPPDPQTVKTHYVQGVLFIHVDRPPAV